MRKTKGVKGGKKSPRFMSDDTTITQTSLPVSFIPTLIHLFAI